jgi:hypothetical protein
MFDQKNIPIKKNDHFMDCLKYLYNFGPTYIPPESNDEGEIIWSGEYVKYPTKQTKVSPKGYYDLVEQQGGNF